MTLWFEVRCAGCGKRVLVSGMVARRIADGLSFVMCDPCGIEYEALTGHQPIALFGSVVGRN